MTKKSHVENYTAKLTKSTKNAKNIPSNIYKIFYVKNDDFIWKSPENVLSFSKLTQNCE